MVNYVYPLFTGIILFGASFTALGLYADTKVRSNLVLGLGLMFVGTNSLMESVIVLQSLSIAEFESTYLFLIEDSVRAVFIMLWAGMEILFALTVTERWSMDRRMIPVVAVILASLIPTFYLNLIYGESIVFGLKAWVLSSYFRVLVFLVPIPLIVGIYLFFKLYKPLKTQGPLLLSIAFIIHGVTLPLYPILKSSEVLLALWYVFGGIIPGLVATQGIRLISKE